MFDDEDLSDSQGTEGCDSFPASDLLNAARLLEMAVGSYLRHTSLHSHILDVTADVQARTSRDWSSLWSVGEGTRLLM